MKISFSVHNEDFETGDSKLLYSKVVETNMTIAEIDKLLELYDGFHSVLEVGQTLCFWDIYCFFADADDLKEKISSIPTYNSIPQKSLFPEVLVIKEFDPGNTEDALYPDGDSCFFYRLTRYELGASGEDGFILFASNHPWLMVFIGGAIWDITKYLCGKIINLVKYRGNDGNSQKKTVCFSVKKCYRDFSNITNISEENCQIVFLSRRKNNSFDVRIRTIDNQCFEIRCTSKGKITSIKPIDIRTWHREGV